MREHYLRGGPFKKAGLKEVPCLIEDLSDTEALIRALAENVGRRDLTDWEKGRAVGYYYLLAFGMENGKPVERGSGPQKPVEHAPQLLDKIINALINLEHKQYGQLRRPLSDFELKVRELADRLGISYRKQRKYLTFFKLRPEEVEELKRIFGSQAEAVARTLSKVGPEGRRKVIEEAKKEKEYVEKVTGGPVKLKLDERAKAELEEVAEALSKLESEEAKRKLGGLAERLAEWLKSKVSAYGPVRARGEALQEPT